MTKKLLGVAAAALLCFPFALNAQEVASELSFTARGAAGLDAAGQPGRVESVWLWPEEKMPNSRNLDLKDSIANERVYQVARPWMDHFYPTVSTGKAAPAVLIFAGGGYARLSYEVSGNLLARWFASLGMHAFVVYHRLPTSPDLFVRENGPLQDGQRALRIVRYRAAQWGIDPQKVGAMGCSAGGHLACSLGTHDEDVSTITDQMDGYGYRADFLILVSPVISLDAAITHQGSRRNLLGPDADDMLVREFSNECRVDAQTPPTLLIHAHNDPAVSPLNSIRFYTAMKEAKRPCSLHIFPTGGHNISLEPQPGTTQQWSVLAEGWLREMEIL